jgi:hypothetical protein
MKYLVNNYGTDYAEAENLKEAHDMVTSGKWNYTSKTQYMHFMNGGNRVKIILPPREGRISNRRMRQMFKKPRKHNNRKGSSGSRKRKQYAPNKQGNMKLIKHAV